MVDAPNDDRRPFVVPLVEVDLRKPVALSVSDVADDAVEATDAEEEDTGRKEGV